MATADQHQVFEDWVADHRGIVIKVARSFTATSEDLDDLVQEILVKVWASIPSYRAESKPSTWIYRIALNRALTWHRDEKKHTEQRPITHVPELASSAQADSAVAVAAIYKSIRSLKRVDRSLVLLSLDGYSYAEMGELMGMTVTNVGARLSRAKTQLSAALEERHD